MPKIYAEIPGFKKLDYAIGDVLRAQAQALREIETSRAGPSGKKRLPALASVEELLRQSMRVANDARGALWRDD
jgi:hypothetical protein